MSTRLFSISLSATWLCLLLSPAGAADDPGYLMGQAWERPIIAGIATQDRELKRMQPQALAGKYQRIAARRAERDEMVRRFYLLGRAHGKNEEALRQLAEAARTPRQKSTLLAQADAADRQARQAYREALALAPQCYFVYHDLGVLALLGGAAHAAEAIQSLNQSAQINRRYPAPLRKLALIYRGRKEYAKAAAVLYKLIPLAPTDVVARMTLAGALTELGRLGDARAVVDELLRSDPDNVGFRALGADIDFRAGKVDEAQQEFRRLAEASPANPVPLQGFLRGLDWKRKNKKPVTAADYIWVMTRMMRLERRTDVRAQIKAQIKKLKQQEGERAGIKQAGKLPGPEDLARLLTGPDEEGRWRVVSFLNAVNQPPPKLLRDAVVSRLSSKREPSVRVRTLAIEIAGKQFGWGWMPIARLVATQDPAPAVRMAGIDAIGRMGAQGVTARAGAVLVLGTFLADPDRSVAAAARLGILSLGRGRLRLDENASDAAHRAAFSIWWQGARGEDLAIESLRRYADLRDPFLEDVVGLYARSDSFFVRQAAYEAFGAAQAFLRTPKGRAWYRGKRGAGFAAFEQWLETLPAVPGGRLTRENASVWGPRCAKWLDARPR